MLSKHTGKILHIDFGDCFEVAMRREKYPETIPFRLTRMVISAMEVCAFAYSVLTVTPRSQHPRAQVSAIEGMFRSICERVMGVLRAHQDSLMAMLEAFIHDPLIKWRLLRPDSQVNQSSVQKIFSALMHVGRRTITSRFATTSFQGRPCSKSTSPPTDAKVNIVVRDGLCSRKINSIAPSLKASLEESFGYHSSDAFQQSMGAQVLMKCGLVKCKRVKRIVLESIGIHR